MAILLVHKSIEVEQALERAYYELNPHMYDQIEVPGVLCAHNAVLAWNSFQELSDIEAVFIGFDLAGLQDTISSGMVVEYRRHGFGFGRKPLVAVSLHNNGRLKQAGCNYGADGDGIDFLRVLQQIKLDRRSVREMSHAR